VGGPERARTDRFEVSARANGDISPADATDAATAACGSISGARRRGGRSSDQGRMTAIRARTRVRKASQAARSSSSASGDDEPRRVVGLDAVLLQSREQPGVAGVEPSRLDEVHAEQLADSGMRARFQPFRKQERDDRVERGVVDAARRRPAGRRP
jgi:hypothetical protein